MLNFQNKKLLAQQKNKISEEQKIKFKEEINKKNSDIRIINLYKKLRSL
jgi:hypothetical protein